MVNCIGVLVRRTDGDTCAIWMVDIGFSQDGNGLGRPAGSLTRPKNSRLMDHMGRPRFFLGQVEPTPSDLLGQRDRPTSCSLFSRRLFPNHRPCRSLPCRWCCLRLIVPVMSSSLSSSPLARPPCAVQLSSVNLRLGRASV